MTDGGKFSSKTPMEGKVPHIDDVSIDTLPQNQSALGRDLPSAFSYSNKLSVDAVMLRPDIYEEHGYPLPQTEESAGIDLRACIDEPMELGPNQVELLPSGLKIKVPMNHAAYLLPRSGLGHKNGIVLGNLVGLIDADYTGEIKISCWNRGNDFYTVSPGDRIAQLVIAPVYQPDFNWVDSLEKTERNEGGFGHTGTT